MRRGRMLVFLLAVLLLLPVMRVSAEGELGAIRVTVVPEMEGSGLRLYYVGILTDSGLQLMPEFGGGFVKGQDLQTRELAAWLEELASEGLEKQIGKDGTAMFTGLPEGVYLLTQPEPAKGYYPIVPVLVALPEQDGSWLAQVSPKVELKAYAPPATGQSAAPVLGGVGMVASPVGIGVWHRVWNRKRKK